MALFSWQKAFIYTVFDAYTSRPRVTSVVIAIIITCQETARRGGLRVWALQLDCVGFQFWLYHRLAV